MAYEPRPVPEIEGEILPRHWYCLDCGIAKFTRADTVAHWSAQHGDGDKPLEGIDICQGEQLDTLRARRNAWIEQQAERFAAELHEGFGADDFVAEAEIRSA